MLVVVEVPDGPGELTPSGILFELGLLAEDNARVVEDDPEDLDGALSLRTENCMLGLTRIVGIAQETGEMDNYTITPLND